jgi:16S rRNA (guanine1207-N2)-methyltransferase
VSAGEPSGQYFERQPSARSRRGSVRLALADVGALHLATDRGVFSADSVDVGTMVLLREAPMPPPGGDLLDLGCGYGPIALVLAARSPAATVWAIDVNDRALELTAENAVSAGLANVRVARPEDVPSSVRFAAIYSNPPIRVGKPALHELLIHWVSRLEPNGSAWLVVHRNLGSDSLARWLGDQQLDVARWKSVRGYRVLEIRR